MTDKAKIMLGTMLLLISFAGGRYSAQSPEIKTQEKLTTVATENKVQDTHTTTETKTIIEPDGKKETDTKTTTDVVSKTTDTQKQDESLKQDVIPTKQLNISGLIGFAPGFIPTYGVAVSKQILGPVTIGGFGFTTGMFGVSIGVNF